VKNFVIGARHIDCVDLAFGALAKHGAVPTLNAFLTTRANGSGVTHRGGALLMRQLGHD